MGMFKQVLADMRERAAVARDAAKNNPDGTVHHEAVANMLEYLAARAEEAHKREIAGMKGERKGILKANESLSADNTRLRDEMAAKDAEIAKIRSLVKELADALVVVWIKATDERDAIMISQAQRIIAELAKVSDGYWTDACNGHPSFFAGAGSMAIHQCIGNCRAVAAYKESEVK